MTSEIVIQADLGGLSIAITQPTGSDEASLNEQLDLFAKVLGRQRAKITLTEKLVDHLSVKKALQALPDRRQEVLKSRASERARQMAAMEAAYNSRDRRSPFTPTQPQRTALETFDAETIAEADRFAKEKQGLELQLPIIEAQISRLRAVIAGRDPVEPLEAESAALAERAA